MTRGLLSEMIPIRAPTERQGRSLASHRFARSGGTFASRPHNSSARLVGLSMEGIAEPCRAT
jgi:hypothetical protein